jgi:hypothetical protein
MPGTAAAMAAAARATKREWGTHSPGFILSASFSRACVILQWKARASAMIFPCPNFTIVLFFMNFYKFIDKNYLVGYIYAQQITFSRSC